MEREETETGVLETWTVEEVAAAYDKGEIALIDVRTPQEYMFEHIEGALLLPMPFVNSEKLPSQEGKRLVIYCGSGMGLKERRVSPWRTPDRLPCPVRQDMSRPLIFGFFAHPDAHDGLQDEPDHQAGHEGEHTVGDDAGELRHEAASPL
jgi:hypothetical protein